MLIRSIELINFRQYIHEKIEFSTDSNKNTTIILGENGYGKTTLIRAFLWGLYRTNGFKNNKILLNSKVADKMAPNSCESVKVILEVNHKDLDYIIETEQVYYKSEKGEISKKTNSSTKITKIITPFIKKTITGNAVANEIDDILNNNMKDYFFYDGENNVIDKVSSKSNLKIAIEKMMGINEISDLADYFDPKGAKSVFKLLNDDLVGDDDDELVQYELQQKLDKKTKAVDDLKNKIKDTNGEILELEAQIEEYQAFITANKETQEKQDELTDIENDNKKILSSYKQVFQDKVTTLYDPKKKSHLLLEGLFDKCFEEYNFGKIEEISSFDSEKSLSHITEDVIDQLIERGSCLCGAKIENENDVYKHLLSEKEHMEPHDFGRYLNSFITTESINQSTQRAAMNKYKMGLANDFLDILDNYEDNRRTIKKLNKELVDTKDIGIYQEKINEINRTIGQFEGINSNRSTRITELEEEIEEIQQSILDNAADSEHNVFIKECLAYARSIHNMTYNHVSKARKNIRDALENKTNELFSKMYHGNRSIKIGTDFTVMTITDEKELDNSTGIDTVKNFAFVAGMMQTAKKHIVGNDDFEVSENDIYPLVIDAPFSNTDTEHIKNICDVLPNCCDQLIMCMINNRYQIAENDIKDRINKVYRINKLSETEDKIEEVK